MFKTLLQKVLRVLSPANLKQPSTIKGLSLLLGLIGVTVSPEQAEGIITAAVAVIAAIDMFVDEDKPKE